MHHASMYHSLATAHRILMDKLPPHSFYRQTNSASLLRTLQRLWADSGNSRSSRRAEQCERIPVSMSETCELESDSHSFPGMSNDAR